MQQIHNCNTFTIVSFQTKFFAINDFILDTEDVSIDFLPEYYLFFPGACGVVGRIKVQSLELSVVLNGYDE